MSGAVPSFRRLLSVSATLALVFSSHGTLAARARTADVRDEAAAESSAFTDHVDVRDGRLTVRVRDMPLATLLQVIARKSAFRVVTALSMRDLVSADFRDVPLEEGLRRLLKHQNLILVFERAAPTGQASASDLPARLAAVLAWPKGERRPLEGDDLQAGVSGEADAGRDGTPDMHRLVKEALQATEPDDRQEAVTALGHSGLAEAAGPLMAALQDADAAVRNEAVEALKRLLSSSGPEAFPRDDIVGMAARERNPEARIAALEVLQQIVQEWEDTSAQAQLERSSRDPDPRVRAAAARLLADQDPMHEGHGPEKR